VKASDDFSENENFCGMEEKKIEIIINPPTYNNQTKTVIPNWKFDESAGPCQGHNARGSGGGKPAEEPSSNGGSKKPDP